MRRSWWALSVVAAAALVPTAGCGSGGGAVYPLTPPAGVGGTVPARCLLPFESGPCDALVPVFAYESGVCVPRTYGGCEGNENRFPTREECLATCERRPDPNPCPPGWIARDICLECGPAGGCATFGTYCAQLCDETSDCERNRCHEGVCQAHGCL